MSRIDYPSRSPRRYSPIYRTQRSRSRERYLVRRSPFNRNRLPIHQRLSDRSRSIEKRLSYPSKHEVEKRSFRRSSRSPRRRRRSSSRSNSRHRSRSRSRRRSRLESRSRSKERDERSKFTFYTTTNEVNEILLNKSDDYIRDFGPNNELANYGSYLQQQQQSMLDKPLLEQQQQKMPLLDKPPIYDNQFADDVYYDNQQLNSINQLSQLNQLKMNNPVNNLYLNQSIPVISDSDFHQANAPNLSRALRERLDVVHPSTSNALLETPTYLNSSSSNNHLNTFNNNQLNQLNSQMNNTNLASTLNSPLGLNSSAGSNLNSNNHHHSNNSNLTNSNRTSSIVNLDNGYFSRSQDIDLRGSNSNNLVFKDSLLGNGPSDPPQTLINNQQFSSSSNQDQSEKCMFSHLGCPITTNKDMISKHELECLYNPRNVKAFCNKCKLTVCPEHDCIQELRTELNQTKIKTNWCQNTIKLTNTSLLNNDYEQQVLSIHYSVDNKEIVKQIKVGSHTHTFFAVVVG